MRDTLPSRARRVGAGLCRRLRTAALRLRYRAVRFGPGCDLRRGLHVHLGRGGGARFGARCVLDRGLSVESHGRLIVGDRVIFGHRCTLGVRDRVEIGDDTLIAEMVSIRDHDHAFADPGRPIREQGFAVSPVRIGRDVWIGGKATVLRGVSIGDGAVIGANAVVTRDVPAGAVAVGVPARVVGRRGAGAEPLGAASDAVPPREAVPA
ncbi:MAG: acyltransferase [Planctomycetota bacterium]